MFADYYVLTNDPWRLAKLAAESAVKPEHHDSIEYDGEAEFTISATIYDSPPEDSLENDDEGDDDNGDNWEPKPAPFILEVFPEDNDDWRVGRRGKMLSYPSIEAAFGLEDEPVELAPAAAAMPVPSARRWHDAWLIQQGACNPSGVARALVAAIDEARAESEGTDSVRADLACRMICHQLAFLLNVAGVDSDYSQLYAELERMAKASQESTAA